MQTEVIVELYTGHRPQAGLAVGLRASSPDDAVISLLVFDVRYLPQTVLLA